MGSKRVDWEERRAEIADAALELFLKQPREQVTLAAVAERLDMNYWRVARSFAAPDILYRAAVTRLIERLADRIGEGPQHGSSVFETIRAYAQYAATIVRSDDYRHLLYLIIRDGLAHQWVAELYRSRIARPLQQGLAEVVSAAGERSGTLLALRPGAGKRFLSSLELALAVPKLLPVPTELPEAHSNAVAAAVRQAMAETLSLELSSQAA